MLMGPLGGSPSEWRYFENVNSIIGGDIEFDLSLRHESSINVIIDNDEVSLKIISSFH